MQSVNSLKGAALAQGMMLACGMREQYEGVCVTETHPKVLLAGCFSNSWSRMAESHAIRSTKDFDACAIYKLEGNKGAHVLEDERDAAISAIAARESYGGQWKHDLSIDRDEGEQDPKNHWCGPVSYCWPEAIYGE